MRVRIPLGVVGALVAVLSGPAAAATITFQFEGVVTRLPNYDPGYFDESVSPGAIIRGAYTFDPAAPDLLSDPGFGHYEVLETVFEVGNYRFTSAEPIDPRPYIPPLRSFFLYEGGGGALVYQLRSVFHTVSSPPGPPAGQPGRSGFQWSVLIDHEGISLPTTPPPFDPSGENRLQFWGFGIEEEILFDGRLTRIVPEPGSGWLLALPIALIGLYSLRPLRLSNVARSK